MKADSTPWKLIRRCTLLAALLVVLSIAGCEKNVRTARTGTVGVLKWNASRKAGDEVAKGEVGSEAISEAVYRKLESVVDDTPENRSLLVGSRLSRNVTRNDFVRYSDILEIPPEAPSKRIGLGGHRAFPLQVDLYRTKGMLRVEDRVDIIGVVSVGGRPPRAYTLIENVRVLAIGGRSASLEAKSQRRGRDGMREAPRATRMVTLEVHKDTAMQLAELLPRVRGNVWVLLRNPKEPTGPLDGKINPKLLPVLAEPLPDDAGLE